MSLEDTVAIFLSKELGYLWYFPSVPNTIKKKDPKFRFFFQMKAGENSSPVA